MKSVHPLNIVFCIDDNFAVHLAALLKSITANTDRRNKLHFHVFSAELSELNRAKLTLTAGEGNQIQFYEIDQHRFENAHISQSFVNRLSVVTYFRILVPEMLTSIDSTALFMDADIIVNADIVDLFDVDLKGNVAGVVADSLIEKGNYSQTLGIESRRYFNAGLMLIDLAAWRREAISSNAMDMVDSGKDYKFNDQDILNLALKGEIEFLDEAWNVQQSSLERFESANEAKVIHYNGAEKPWQYACIHPYTQLYRQFKAQTRYADIPLTHFIDDHDRQLIDLIEQSKASDVYIYGAGQKGRRIVCYLQCNLPKVNICGLIDRSPNMDEFNGVSVASDIPQIDETRIVVASSAYTKEIIKQLKQKLVPADRVIAVVDE